jgi:bifunctional UDP-N-acetylglucosamine pyrophosphorylase/glucosamine-1-phosphate N-acetyltransferase
VRVLSPRALVVVVGHAGDAVREALAAPDLSFVTQDPPRGTGDAARIALAALPDDGVTLVVNGDCPLIPAATFGALVDVARAGKLAILTALVSDPTGLGRVVRDTSGAVRAIVEERDASAEERLITEIYTGALAAPTRCLTLLRAAQREHAQREYYLTEAARPRSQGRVEAHIAPNEKTFWCQRPRAIGGDRAHRRRAADTLMRGISLADPGRTTCAACSLAATTCGSTSVAC